MSDTQAKTLHDTTSTENSDDGAAIFIDHLLNSTTAGLSVLDRDLRLVRLNEAMRGLLLGVTTLDYHQGDFLLKEGMTEVMKERWKYVVDRCFSGEAMTYKVSYPIGDRMHHFETFLNPYIVNGRAVYVVNTSTDITDAVTIDKTERRFQALIERAEDVKVMMEADGTVLYRSPASARVLGYANSEEMGYAPFAFIHPDDRTYCNGVYQSALSQAGVPVHFEFRMVKKDGSDVYMDGTFTNLLDDPAVNAVVANVRDVTARVMAERERERIAADLVQRVKELEQFAYIVSHNLRSPVANILGIANALKTGADEAMQRQLLDGVFTATERLDGVLRDLNNVLDVKQRIDEKKETVLLPKLLEDIRASIDDLLQRERVELSYDFSEVDNLFTLRSYIHSILYNLIANAVKYRRPDVVPTVRIVSKRLGGNVVLHVADNGLGIDLEKNQQQLFGLYKRFHDHAEGKGVGLFMVKTQMEALGGNVTVTSRLNDGTQFTLTFPA